MTEQRIVLGVIGRPHGVRGHVHVVSYAADPSSLTAYGPLTDRKGRRFTLRWRGDGIAEVSEITDRGAVPVADRSAAERLTNTELAIAREQLPPPDEDEFYLADLVGLSAIDGAGVALGRVAAIHDYGAGTSLEIARPEAPPLLVPFTRACVPDVDLTARRMVVLTPHEIEAGEAGGA